MPPSPAQSRVSCLHFDHPRVQPTVVIKLLIQGLTIDGGQDEKNSGVDLCRPDLTLVSKSSEIRQALVVWVLHLLSLTLFQVMPLLGTSSTSE
jgi:hypothetical protein